MLYLGWGILQPLHREAGGEQGGLAQLLRQPQVEVPAELAAGSGLGVMGQQFGADIKLQEGFLASLSPQRLAHQP